ncbi:lysophospholipid acyltransferase family protein [uncultured Limnohabitans sp.]|jgi:Kdo2-lipid IVA lauroyltransferase/acyltransferase|uniref:lysophospholipid acyltransferase family protein n=1 Tax=uncultured Limnohabitans sp. TaxID=768543 RepID=UPI00261DF599|nr:lysophospholipid acyltransferase family protein [uncultured Limnohabitans sp.]
MSRWFRFFSHWPLWALHALGWLGGWAAWLLSGSYRRRFLDNARQAGLGLRAVLGAVGHSGRMSAELPRLWLGRTPHLEWADDRAAEEAYAQGQGVLFLTPHMGCFEVTAQALALRFGAKHGGLTVLYRPARLAALNEVMALARNRPGLQAVPTTLAGVRQMIKALRAGKAVGLLPDQVPPEGMGLWAPYFGQSAYTMTLAARLALQTGARVVLIWGERLPWGGGYRLHTKPLGHDLSTDLETAVVQINQAMEAMVRVCPQQYLWGYARYKAPRKEA